MGEEQLSVNSEILQQAIANLVGVAGFEGDFHLYPLTGGANNRVFRVEIDGFCALLKAYFQHADDPRDRLRAEFAFCRFAWENGIRCLPQPLACDPQNNLGLYEFIEGRRLLHYDVTEEIVRQAIDFYLELNCYKELPGAQALPRASEACFTIAEHLQCVEWRLKRLKAIDDTSDIMREAINFIQNDLSQAWKGVADSVRSRANELNLVMDSEIAQRDRCLSPSDFGFHNAILEKGGRLRFIDFEYAGWDDSAKLVCDFFCQPAVPVSQDHFDLFVETVVQDLSEPEKLRQRIALLLPVYRIKWCCILLNDFLSAGSARRRFARSTVDQDGQKVRQLQKARQALQSVAPK